MSTGVFLSVLLFLLFVIFIRRKYNFWRKLGVQGPTPTFPFGNLRGVGTQFHSSELIDKLYHIYKGQTPLVGIYFFLKPVALVLDLDVAQDILVQNFKIFPNHGFFYYNERDDPLTAHLFALEGEKWKQIRRKLGPAFTAAKVSIMFPLMKRVAQQLDDALSEQAENCKEIDVVEYASRFTTDVIGNCAFGIDCNSLNERENIFYRIGRRILTEMRTFELIRFLLCSTYVGLARFLRMKIVVPEARDFYTGILRETIKYREETGTVRKDLIDMMLQIRRDGKLEDSTEVLGSMTFNEIAAQVFGFFIANFETSALTITACLFELSLQPHLQELAHEEIVRCAEEDVTYKSLMGMKYLTQVINEILRKYPVVHFLQRQSIADYKVPGMDVIIPAGTLIYIPLCSIQNDPEYYPNPSHFDPDRFSPENIANIPDHAYMPFGEGPRYCIGRNLGLTQTLLCIATLLRKYKFSQCAKTPKAIRPNPKSVFINTAGVWLKVERR
ncbi:probable cytochrome P450 6a14 [Lutzomyia longipalpis]|uniref:probable cytochrome P450 6a14 n=1 Tax=Lutzomyia longipalpis TaxID=7200 RepID=UPI00248387EB|nr:probable cytochrome P450 6a14 [Lutzomyia longipalpis]